jgi:alkylhydroperoxidase family enzyme
MNEQDIGRLRAVGLSDGAIHDATQVIAYFNYINRIADGLDVALEPEMG